MPGDTGCKGQPPEAESKEKQRMNLQENGEQPEKAGILPYAGLE